MHLLLGQYLDSTQLLAPKIITMLQYGPDMMLEAKVANYELRTTNMMDTYFLCVPSKQQKYDETMTKVEASNG